MQHRNIPLDLPAPALRVNLTGSIFLVAGTPCRQAWFSALAALSLPAIAPPCWRLRTHLLRCQHATALLAAALRRLLYACYHYHCCCSAHVLLIWVVCRCCRGAAFFVDGSLPACRCYPHLPFRAYMSALPLRFTRRRKHRLPRTPYLPYRFVTFPSHTHRRWLRLLLLARHVRSRHSTAHLALIPYPPHHRYVSPCCRSLTGLTMGHVPPAPSTCLRSLLLTFRWDTTTTGPRLP